MSINLRKLRIDASDVHRFWNLASRPNEGCWNWIGSKDRKGYGNFSMDGKTIRAARLAYFIHHDIDPGDKLVCHECDNPTCINPLHLFLGTPRDNIEDRDAKGRAATGARHGTHTKPETRVFGERHPRSKLTDTDASDIRSSTERTRKLAIRYGVDASTIRRIRAGSLRSTIACLKAAGKLTI